LLADGIHETGAGAMEQLPLIHFLPIILLLHLPFLPRIAKDTLKAECWSPNTASQTHKMH
jgi:hypothetical protein